MEAQVKIRSEKGKVAEKPTSINAQDGKTQPTHDERLTASRAVTVFDAVFVSYEGNVCSTRSARKWASLLSGQVRKAHAGRCARGELVPHSCSRFRTFRSVVAVVVERPDGKPELKMMFGTPMHNATVASVSKHLRLRKQ